MEAIVERAAGLDVHQGSVVACVIIGAAMRPFAVQQACLATIPGVDELTAASVIAEIGVDMAAFGTAQRLAAWAKLANKVPSAKPMEGQRRAASAQPITKAQASRSSAALARAIPTSKRRW